jgi:hypothetical protein
MTSIARFSTGANLLRSGVASISFADIVAVFYARLCFVFFSCVCEEKSSRLVCFFNCFFRGTKKRKKISGSRRSAGSRLGSFFCEIFSCPCFCFFCEFTHSTLCAAAAAFFGVATIYVQKLVMCFIYMRNQISIIHDPFRTVCRSLARSLARARSCNRDVFIKTQTFLR